MNPPQVSWLPDGRRLHMNHGPIDLIVEAWGEANEVTLAYEQAAARFRTILTELVAELPALRRPVARPLLAENPAAAVVEMRSPPPRTPPHKGDSETLTPSSPLWGGVRGGGIGSGVVDRLAAPGVADLASPTARRMAAAVAPFAPVFITPMAAVAGAVADEMLAVMCAGRTLARAYVNNGGDIALHLTPGETMSVAIGGTGGANRFAVSCDLPVRGVATSGWRGRSHSLGIADAVTVLAATGAAAETPHFSSRSFDSSEASRTVRAERSSTSLARSAI